MLVVAAALAVGTLAPAAAGADSYLYSVDGADATATPVRGGYRLSIGLPQARITRFTDRPLRRVSAVTPPAFLRTWASNGFGADRPNASLVGRSGRTRLDTVVELGQPRWNGRTRRISFFARPLVRASRLPRAFRDTALFIDNSAQSQANLNLINLSSVPLTIVAVSPPPASWRTDHGLTAPAAGNVISLDGAPVVNYGIANTHVGTTAGIVLVGDHHNAYEIRLAWSESGVPTASLRRLDPMATGISVSGLGDLPMTLMNQQPVTDTGIYQVIFNRA